MCRVRLLCLMGLCLIGLTACAISRPIYLRNEATGKTVVCGPFFRSELRLGKEQDCLQRAADEGYVRVR
jgi:hypothetical protein